MKHRPDPNNPIFREVVIAHIDDIEKCLVRLCNSSGPPQPDVERPLSFSLNRLLVFSRSGWTPKAQACHEVANGRVGYYGYVTVLSPASWSVRKFLRSRGWTKVDDTEQRMRPPAKLCRGCPNLLRCTMEGNVEA